MLDCPGKFRRRRADLKKLFTSLAIIALFAMFAGCATPLHTAAGNGDTRKVAEFLDKEGYDVNVRHMGVTPLHRAASHGHIDTVRLLLDRGADINARNKSGYNALMYAAMGGHTDVAKFLLDRGADIDSAMAVLEGLSVAGASRTKARVTTGLKLLERLAKQQEIGGQSVTAKSSTGISSPSRINSDVDEVPKTKASPNKNAYAIVIGIEQYRQGLPPANFAAHDAQLVGDYLTKVLGYHEENVITLLNDHASNVDLAKYFEKWLPNNVEKDSTVFVYFSGHGAPDLKTGSAYLVPYDGDPSFIAETGYSLKRMYDALGKLPAREVIVALDSCFSGAGGRSVIAKGARPLVMNIQNNVVLPGNMTVLSASSGDQISSTYDEKGHGLFTYFMLKGIKNEDVVKPDGSIKMDDLFGYVKPQVERIARKQYNNEQSPQLTEPRKN